MVGIAMVGDQDDTIIHMKAKGVAVEWNMNTMTSADLLSTLRAVINDRSILCKYYCFLKDYHWLCYAPYEKNVKNHAYGPFNRSFPTVLSHSPSWCWTSPRNCSSYRVKLPSRKN